MAHSHKHDNDNFVETCTEALRNSGARITQARLAVLKALDQAEAPLAPREIIELIQADKKLQNIDQVSVYRILERLLELDLVHQVGPNGQYIRCSHISCEEPLHILTVCPSCGATDELDVPEDVLSPMLWYLRSQHGFQPSPHFFQINGICKQCQR